MSPSDENLRCRVCGLLQDAPPWGESGLDSTQAICDCCGTEFGYEDITAEAARAARRRWIASGAKWFTPRFRPQDWDLEEQLKQVPSAFK